MTQLSPALSVNIITAAGKVWRWQFDLIQRLKAQSLIDVVDVLSNDNAVLCPVKSIALLHKCDAVVFRSPVDAFEVVDATDLKSHEVVISQEGKKAPVLINLTELNVPAKYLISYDLGVVETHFSDKGDLKSQYLAVSEYSNKQRQVHIAISVSAAGGVKVLSEVRPSLDTGSLTRNVNQYFRLMNLMWQRALIKLQKESVQASSFSATAFNSISVNPRPATVDIPKLSQRFVGNVTDKLLQKYRRHEQWVLLLKFRHETDSDVPLSFGDYIELIPPKNVFWADPFVATEDGRHFVFFEELPFETERGHLSCIEAFKDGSYSESKIILKQPFHLSFPNIFKHESVYYMIPESGDHGTIDLYRCTEFPYQWEFAHTLIEDLHAYDPTLFEQDGRWWLFATVAAEKGMSGNEELHIYHADSPMSSQWCPHKANPVISDASIARPAGQFFSVNGNWFRPSQDCAGHYGAGLNINKVIRLNENEYVEQKISCSRPDWNDNLIALHTLNFNNHVAVADALRVTPKGIF